MTPEEASELLNGVTFRPGWKITTQAHTWLHHELDIYVTLTTVDTSYPGIDGEYRKPHKFTARRIIRVEPEDDEMVILKRFLDAAHELDWHEDREFLRVWRDGRWTAPLHPHTPEGEVNWVTLQENQPSYLTRG